MSTLIEGYHIASLVTPVEDTVGGNGTAVPFQVATGTLVDALAASGGEVATIQFDGTEEDGLAAKLQGVLDGTIIPGNYNIHIKAKEQGSGVSFNSNSLSYTLLNEQGKPYGGGNPPYYNRFWGPLAAKNLTGTFDWYTINATIPSGEDAYTANSLGLWVFAWGYATKQLVIDEVIVEYLAAP